MCVNYISYLASELKNNNKVSIRWYETTQDQYHTKLLYIKKSKKCILIGGSANYTTRNLADLNLENVIKITADSNEQVVRDVENYFHRLWHNNDGTFTSPYESNEKALTPILKITYWIQKISGLTTY